MADRRDHERRDDIDMNNVTLGEVYRLLQVVDRRTLDMQAAEGDHAVLLAEHTLQIAAVKERQSSTRQWVSGLVSGAVVGVILILVQHFVK